MAVNIKYLCVSGMTLGCGGIDMNKKLRPSESNGEKEEQPQSTR